MRILLSGMSKMQANRPRRRDYNTSINAFYHALKAARHNVDWRLLEYNEKNLSKYDLLILGLTHISEFSCAHLYETLLATRCENVLYLVNDWKCNSSIRLLMEGDIFRDFVFKNNTGNRLDRKQVYKDGNTIEKCREQMFRKHTNVVGPFFEGWGNRDIIIEGTPFREIHEFDPSAFYLDNWEKIKPLPFEKRAKAWIYGALSNYSKWHERLHAKWKIYAFNKKTFIQEEELVKLWHARNIGALFPKYKASGSGWWRARYCHAILCGNVIYADQSELVDTKIWDDLHYIEEQPIKHLKEIAAHQGNWLKTQMPSWNKVVDTVDTIVRDVL